MAGTTKSKASKAAQAEEVTAAPEASTELVIELSPNETVEERRAKRIAERTQLQEDAATRLNTFVYETFGIELHVAVEASTFVLSAEDGEAFYENATAAVTDYLRNLDVKELESESVWTLLGGDLVLSWYDIATEYGDIEVVEGLLTAWRRANPTSISDVIVTTVQDELGLFVRVSNNAGATGEAYGNVDEVLKAVYIQVSKLRDENQRAILPSIAQSPIALASNIDADAGEDWAVDIMHGAKRYGSDEAFDTALLSAKAKAATILATRYGTTVPERTRVVADDDLEEEVGQVDELVPPIDDEE